VLEDPELKSVIVAAQGSLRKTFSELESAADSAMTSAREVLESATLQANHTVLESQASLRDLLESITTTIATAVYKARKLGANITSCISGQEEAARAVVKQTGKATPELQRVGCCNSHQPFRVAINSSFRKTCYVEMYYLLVCNAA
jgi:hypothetical protein